MNYQETTNDELFSMFLEHNEYAEDMLFNRFKIIINSNLKKYNGIIKQLNLNKSDLYSEALFGVFNGLYNYKSNRNASISTFVDVCVNRRLCNYLKKNNRNKNIINSMALSLDNTVIEDNLDPLKVMINNEFISEVYNNAKNKLSDFEYLVFCYKLCGYKNSYIAKRLKKNVAQITNANQRIKKKIYNA